MTPNMKMVGERRREKDTKGVIRIERGTSEGYLKLMESSHWFEVFESLGREGCPTGGHFDCLCDHVTLKRCG